MVWVGFCTGWVLYGLGLVWVGYGTGWVWYWLGLVQVGFGKGLVWYGLGSVWFGMSFDSRVRNPIFSLNPVWGYFLTLIFRIVNMLDKTKLDEETIWKIVQDIRKSFLSEYTEPQCQYNDGKEDKILLSNNNIKNNIKNLEKKLEQSQAYTENRNVSDETLQKAAKMFTFLNHCPPKLLSFLENLFTTGRAKDMILGISNAKNTFESYVKQSSSKILIKLMETLKLKQFEKIQIITKGKCYNKNISFDNCEKTLNSTHEEKGIFIKSNVELPNPYITPTGPFPLPSYFLFLLIPNLFNGKL